MLVEEVDQRPNRVTDRELMPGQPIHTAILYGAAGFT
jgi:hypothetical protein